jgi:hypothetical protein
MHPASIPIGTVRVGYADRRTFHPCQEKDEADQQQPVTVDNIVPAFV